MAFQELRNHPPRGSRVIFQAAAINPANRLVTESGPLGCHIVGSRSAIFLQPTDVVEALNVQCKCGISVGLHCPLVKPYEPIPPLPACSVGVRIKSKPATATTSVWLEMDGHPLPSSADGP
jgi:hypothetical protein